jgi:valyl-tRNA synthetase
METGYDILFFWVARMIMLGIANTGTPPFKTVYLHGLVRDPNRQKMSKTKGNVIDPLETIKKYGTDALRMALTISTTPGNDLALPDSRLEAGRNFANKLWNGARFVLNTIESSQIEVKDINEKPAKLEDRWIISRLEKVKQDVNKMLADFQIGQAEQVLRDFLWDEFFDWYLEMAKIRINEGDLTPVNILAEVLEKSCLLLHPFMPFITEEIWQNLVTISPSKSNGKESVMISTYPNSNKALIDEKAEEELKEISEVIRTIRNLRAELKIDPYINIEALLSSEKYIGLFEENRKMIEILGKANPLRITAQPEQSSSFLNTTSSVLDYSTIVVPLDDLIDAGEEKIRLSEEIETVELRIEQLEKRLSSNNFISKAPQEVIEKEKIRLEESAEKLKNLTAQLQNLR